MSREAKWRLEEGTFRNMDSIHTESFESSNPQSNHFDSEEAEAMSAFRREIDGVVAREKAHPEEGAHLAIYPNFRSGDLTLEDKEIWHKLQAKELSKSEFEAWCSEIEESSSGTGSEQSSRELFMAFVGNKVAAILAERQAKERFREAA